VSRALAPEAQSLWLRNPSLLKQAEKRLAAVTSGKDVVFRTSHLKAGEFSNGF
jgi:hypothetical protein